jgi:hypothetical protein
MSEPDTINVDPAQLCRHAARLGQSAQGVETATQAARTVRLDHGAYGQVCAFVPQLLARLSDPLAGGLSTLGLSIRDTAGRLRATAASYVDADAQSEQRLRDAAGGGA